MRPNTMCRDVPVHSTALAVGRSLARVMGYDGYIVKPSLFGGPAMTASANREQPESSAGGRRNHVRFLGLRKESM